MKSCKIWTFFFPGDKDNRSYIYNVSLFRVTCVCRRSFCVSAFGVWSAQGEWVKALTLLDEMRMSGVRINSMTYSAAVKVRVFFFLISILCFMLYSLRKAILQLVLWKFSDVQLEPVRGQFCLIFAGHMISLGTFPLTYYHVLWLFCWSNPSSWNQSGVWQRAAMGDGVGALGEDGDWPREA